MRSIHFHHAVVASAGIPRDALNLRSVGGLTFLLVMLVGLSGRARGETVTNTLPGRTLVRMVADPERGVVYALNPGTVTASGSLLTLDPTTGAILREVETGRLSTDLGLAPEGDSIYVISAGNRTIARYGLDPVSLISTRSIQTPGTYDASLPLRMAVTSGSTIYSSSRGLISGSRSRWWTRERERWSGVSTIPSAREIPRPVRTDGSYTGRTTISRTPRSGAIRW
jgi:sugar lactone lactonase YvrE